MVEKTDKTSLQSTTVGGAIDELAGGKPPVQVGRVGIRWWDWLVTVALGAMAMAWSLHGSDMTYPAICRFGAAKVYYYTDSQRTYDNMTSRHSDHYRTKVHPLFSLVAYTPTLIVHRLSGMTMHDTVRTVFALVAAVWLVGMYWVLRLMGLKTVAAGVFAGLLGASASGVFFLVVPETLLFSAVSVLAGLFVLVLSGRRRLPPWVFALGSGITLSITVTNWMVGLLVTWVRQPRAMALRLSIYAFCGVLFLWAIQKMVFPSAELFFYSGEERQYVRPLTLENLKVSTWGFFLTPMVMPEPRLVWDQQHGKLVISAESHSAGSGWATAWGKAGVFLWAGLLILGGGVLLRPWTWPRWVAKASKGLRENDGSAGASPSHSRRAGADDRLDRGTRIVLLLLVAAQWGLHAVYGDQVFQYSPPFLTLLVIVAAAACLSRARYLAVPMAAALLVCAGINNYRAFGTTIQDLGQVLPLHNSTSPVGRIHMPIGLPSRPDMLKTFVEAEGDFSPGVGSYGIYFWLWDPSQRRLFSPVQPQSQLKRVLEPDGLIPTSVWQAGKIKVSTELCQVECPSDGGTVSVVASRVHLTNTASQPSRIRLYAALRPLGPAGWAVRHLSVAETADALLVDAHPALVATTAPTHAGVMDSDAIGQLAQEGQWPLGRQAAAENACTCSGALVYDMDVPAGQSRSLAFICPVLAGRRAVPHAWTVKNVRHDDAHTPSPLPSYVDMTQLNAPAVGLAQPDPGLGYFRGLSADQLFAAAEAYWRAFDGAMAISLPDARWGEAAKAIQYHLALCLDADSINAAVLNYHVCTRDSTYMLNALQKGGHADLARGPIEQLLAHPFNGRPWPEADNPGQVLWITAEQWQFTKDRAWLEKVYPSVQRLVELVRYYRTTPPPHWVELEGNGFGESLPFLSRSQLLSGAGEGKHPEYTEAFDIAGLHAAGRLAEAMATGLEGQGSPMGGRGSRRAGDSSPHTARQEPRPPIIGSRPSPYAEEASAWEMLAQQLQQQYDQAFGSHLSAQYGQYCVLWPCRLYPLDDGKAFAQFHDGVTAPAEPWKQFISARAHQSLLAGNRQLAADTISQLLSLSPAQGWYVLDEGGASNAGTWIHLHSAWEPSVAMPHGWAIAELFLLMRDCLVLEDGQRLVLMAGIPEPWFTDEHGMEVAGLSTCFGTCCYRYGYHNGQAQLAIDGTATPPAGYLLRLPPGVKTVTASDGTAFSTNSRGEWLLPANVRTANILFMTPPPAARD